MKLHKEHFNNRSDKLQEEAQFQDSRSEGEVRDGQKIFYEDVRDASDFFLGKVFEKQPRTLLIVGCGDENVTKYFIHGVERIIAIDIAPHSIEKVNQFIRRRKLENRIQAFVMDAHNINLPEQFDMIIGNAVLHHLDIRKVLPQFKELLRPKGKICFLEPLGMNPFINFYRKITPHARTPGEHPFKKEDIAYIRRVFGNFEMKSFYLFSNAAFLFKLARLNPLFKIFWPFFNKIDELTFRVLPETRYYAWIIVFSAQK